MTRTERPRMSFRSGSKKKQCRWHRIWTNVNVEAPCWAFALNSCKPYVLAPHHSIIACWAHTFRLGLGNRNPNVFLFSHCRLRKIIQLGVTCIFYLFLSLRPSCKISTQNLHAKTSTLEYLCRRKFKPRRHDLLILWRGHPPSIHSTSLLHRSKFDIREVSI
jgi:hypothetical protein